jgi:hypothetical protein
MFVIDPVQGSVQVKRRKRSRRHRRNRQVRRFVSVLGITLFVVGVSALALMYLSPSLFHAQQSAPPSFQQTELSRNRLLSLNRELSQAAPSAARPVYPYSVVPGGVEDAKELKWVAEHDPIVAAHYAGFDYDHARVVRLTLNRTAYVSYRIGNHVYWTRRRLTLHKGEKVITDGRITARGRCANRVEELPQQAAAPVEPPAVKFDEPMMPAIGTATQAPPVPFQSALLNRPSGPGSGPLGPLTLYDPIGGGSWMPISPPPIPSGLCGPGKKKGTEQSGCCAGEEGESGGKKKKGGPCGPGVVPEPGTWVLLASGLAAIFWKSRHKFSIAQA